MIVTVGGFGTVRLAKLDQQACAKLSQLRRLDSAEWEAAAAMSPAEKVCAVKIISKKKVLKAKQE